MSTRYAAGRGSTGGPPKPDRYAERPAQSQVLLVGSDGGAIAAVDRIALAAGVSLQVVDAGNLASSWRRADVVLVMVECLAAVAAVDPARRRGVVVVATGSIPDAAWRDAVSLGVEEVVILPDQDRWLVDRLGAIDSGPTAAGPLVGVLGASGGVGASVLAAGLAVAAGREQDEPAALVDLDRSAGGVDLLLGSGESRGLRWKELAGVEGRISGESLRASVPVIDGVSVVTFSREDHCSDPAASTLRSVLDAARKGASLVVVDVARGALAQSVAIPMLDHLVVLARADVRSCVAARNVVEEYADVVPDVLLGVRRPDRVSLPDRVIEDMVPAARIYQIPEVRGLIRRIANGGPAVLPSDRFSWVCGSLVRDLCGDRGEKGGRHD